MKIALLCAALLAVASTGYGQVIGSSYSSHYGPSTPAESYMVGVANVINAQGNYNLATSQAIANLSLARQRNYETWRMMQQARQGMVPGQMDGTEGYGLPGRRRWTTEELNQLARRLAPARLSPGEFDGQTGQILWPSVLQTEDYAPRRQHIETLLTQRAVLGGLPVQGYTRLDEAIRGMTDQLKDRIQEYPPDLYVIARRFMTSLAYEATLAPATSATVQVGARKPPAAKVLR